MKKNLSLRLLTVILFSASSQIALYGMSNLGPEVNSFIKDPLHHPASLFAAGLLTHKSGLVKKGVNIFNISDKNKRRLRRGGKSIARGAEQTALIQLFASAFSKEETNKNNLQQNVITVAIGTAVDYLGRKTIKPIVDENLTKHLPALNDQSKGLVTDAVEAAATASIVYGINFIVNYFSSEKNPSS